MPAGLRTRLEQRLAIGRSHVGIEALRPDESVGSQALALIRKPLEWLADGGPWESMVDEDAVAAIVDFAMKEPFRSPAHLCHLLSTRLRAHSTHVDTIDNGLERLSAHLSVRAGERFGLDVPHLSSTNPAYCRNFASSLSRAYSRVIHAKDCFHDTAVLYVGGLSQCDDDVDRRLHAWNWLVDFDRGTVAAFDPQNDVKGSCYANASALLYSLARLRGDAIPGLHLLVRRHDSLHGGMILFHFARHPIDRGSRWKIASRLRATNFERIVPGWERELEAWDGIWKGEHEVPADDIARFADE